METEKSKLEKLLEKQLFATRMIMICNVLLLCCLLVMTIAVVKLVPKINTTLEQITVLTTQAESVMEDMDTLAKETTTAVTEFNKVIPTLSDASSNIAEISASLTDEGLPKLYETLENLEGLKKLQNIDINSLNDAIKSLSDVVEPLAKFFKVF